MNETWFQIGIVSVVLVLAVIGIATMKSPSKGGDAMSGVISEIQKAVEPQVKEMREAGKKSEIKVKKKSGDDPGKNG
jgi:hypothetical protein